MLSDSLAQQSASLIAAKSQCPLEHCMLSDEDRAAWKAPDFPDSLNALSSIVCFLTNASR